MLAPRVQLTPASLGTRSARGPLLRDETSRQPRNLSRRAHCDRCASGDAHALVAKLPVETFHVRVLNRLTRTNEAQLDAVRIRPGVERAAGKLGTVVHHDPPRQSDRGAQALEHAYDARTRQGAVDLDRHAFTRVVVDDVQRAKAPAVGQRVDHEVHRPPLAAITRARQRHTFGPRDPFPPTPADLEAGLAVHPMHALVVRDHTVTGDQGMEPTVPVPRTHRRVGLQPRQQLGVVGSSAAPIPPGRRYSDPTTRHARRRLVVRASTSHPTAYALRAGAYHFFATTAFNA